VKKKLSILIALVMAISLCVAPAVASANPGIGFHTVGNAVAGLSMEQAHSPDYSVKLYVVDGKVNWAEVSIPVDIPIEDIYELSFWEKIDLLGASGWDINVILGVDCNDNGVFDSDVIDWHIGSGSHTTAALAGDSFVEMDGWGGMTSGDFVPPVTYGGLSADVNWTKVDVINDVTYGWWTPTADGTKFAHFGSMVGGRFEDYLAWLDGAEDNGLIDKGDRVLCVKLVLGGSGMWMDEIAYVDDVTINGDTYDLEPPPVVPTPEPKEPVLERSPDAFDVFVRWGYDSTRYGSDGALGSSIEAAGKYNDTRYMLEIPKGCVVTGATGRINWLWLDSIDGGVLTFQGGDATFSEPCTLYITDGGRLYQDYWTGDWLGGGEWVEVGTFTSIVDGEAHLD